MDEVPVEMLSWLPGNTTRAATVKGSESTGLGQVTGRVDGTALVGK